MCLGLPAFAGKSTRSFAMMVSSRSTTARSRNWSLAHSSISLACVSRIERQRDGPISARPVGEAASLGMEVSQEEGWGKLEDVSMEVRAAGVEIFIAMTE